MCIVLIEQNIRRQPLRAGKGVYRYNLNMRRRMRMLVSERETVAMSLAMTPAAAGRTTRLTALVSEAEAAQITRQAEATRLSVSAYLRERALGASAEPDAGDQAALRQVDALVARMEADLDGAIATVSATIARIDAA